VASKGRFYLLPHDADFSATGEPPRGISDDELSNLLEPVNAGHIVLVLDTCQSASTLDNPEWRRGPLNSRGLAQLAYEKGMYLLAAAQSDGVAKERRDFGHGLLSYALLTEGLDASFSDVAPHDGLVTVNEWLSYAGNRVPSLDAESQLTGRGVKVAHARSQPVQQPRVYYRREWATLALIVARGAAESRNAAASGHLPKSDPDPSIRADASQFTPERRLKSFAVLPAEVANTINSRVETPHQCHGNSAASIERAGRLQVCLVSG
jgi:hypothetical protein